jgi:lantibiotic biosynthesis protein
MTSAVCKNWTASPFFVLRTPLLPVGEMFALSEELEAGTCDDASTLNSALTRDRYRIRARLRSLCERADVREALFLASPRLEREVGCWIKGVTTPDSRCEQRVELSLLRYVLRMASRPTPFGLFAGITLGTVGHAAGEKSCLEIQPRSKYERHTRLDNSYLIALSQSLANDPALRQRLHFFPNPSLYWAAGRIRYVESRRVESDKLSYQLVAVEPTPCLQETLRRASTGIRPDQAARAILAEDPNVSQPEADSFVGELIAQQILISELTPAITGSEPMEDLLNQLRNVADEPASERAIRPLQCARDRMAALDAAGLGASPGSYRDIARTLEKLPCNPDIARLFQVDLTKPAASVCLGHEIVDVMLRGVDLLHRISGCGRSDPLAHFRTEFRRRYGDRDIPFCEALDEDIGIGFSTPGAPAPVPEPLLDGLRFPPQHRRPTDAFSERENVLLRWLTEAAGLGKQEIVLGPQDVSALEQADAALGDLLPLPDSFSVVASLFAGNQEALNSGHYRLAISNVSGPPGASLLGRFCHAHTELTAKIREYLQAEEALRPGAAFAEIVHLPHPRTANVLARPLLRTYEIPYLGRSGAARECQIALSDLAISVIEDRVVLRSRRLGCEVVPRLTGAHNFDASGNLGVYRFLGAVQAQGTASRLSFSFGALSHAPFLPRVVCERFVLFRARWNLSEEQVRALLSVRDSSGRFAAVQSMRRQLGLPRWVAVMDSDRQLPVDLDNILCVEAALPLFRNPSTRTLIELLYGQEDVLATGPDGRFVHELVVPFIRSPYIPPKTAPARWATDTVSRTFPPGSEWLYTKLYTGICGADLILSDIVRPVMRRALSSGAADSWFFVRYADPDWHIRLRLHGDPTRLVREVLPELLDVTRSRMTASDLWRVQLDTYEREIERYGGPEGILLAERLFHADSEAVLDLLETMPEPSLAGTRWRFALAGIDHLFEDLQIPLADRAEITRAARHRAGSEFRADARLQRQISARYRNERAGLQSLLNRTSPEASTSRLFTVLARRSLALQPVVAELRERDRCEALTQPLVKMAGSYIHMNANRVLRSAARAQELVLYDFLSRLYESRKARTRSLKDFLKCARPLYGGTEPTPPPSVRPQSGTQP